jgi:hypothetical protein
MPAPSHHPLLRRGRTSTLLVVLGLAAALVVPLLGPSPATAATASSDAAAAWLAGLVGPDGAAINPGTGQPSLSGTVQVALALVANRSDRDTIDRALAYIGPNAGTYVVTNGADNPGRLGYLLVLATATGGDPRAFGTPAVDLIARLEATYGTVEAGFYGTPDPYNSVFNQSLAIVGLVAAGRPVPAGALTWLSDQQCDSGNSSDGGWQGYRAPSGGGLTACDPSSGISYTGADSNSTAMAVQALVAGGDDAPVGSGLSFLASTQAPATGGFGYYAGDTVDDPNSTALGIQALVAAGDDPSGPGWTTAGGTPASALVAWQLTSGPDTGALASPYSGGEADFLATFQGLWGLAEAAFPFPPLPAPGPSTTTTTTAGGGPTTTAPPAGAAPTAARAAAAVSVAPAFTG